jgi:hypothetical protein
MTVKKKAAAVKSRRSAPKRGGKAGRFFALLLLAGIGLAGGFVARQSGVLHGPIHRVLAVIHLATRVQE